MKLSPEIFPTVIGVAPHILWSKFPWHTKKRFLYFSPQKGNSYQISFRC